MPRRGCQLGVRDPQSLLLLPLLARAHRHRAILRTISVDTSDVFADESRLAPRAVRKTSEVPETSGINLAAGAMTVTKRGMTAPRAKLPAEPTQPESGAHGKSRRCR